MDRMQVAVSKPGIRGAAVPDPVELCKSLDLFFQFGERRLKRCATPRINSGCQLLPHALSGESKILTLPRNCRFFLTQSAPRLLRRLDRLGLLRFDRFTFPSPSHLKIIRLPLAYRAKRSPYSQARSRFRTH